MKYIYYTMNLIDAFVFLFLGCCLDTPELPAWVIKGMILSLIYGIWSLSFYYRRIIRK